MTDAIGIGFFQFDNLVRNRIPFCLFLLSVDCAKIYKGPELEHILRYSLTSDLNFSAEAAQAELQKRKFRPMDPVVIVCDDGLASKKVADSLGTLGFINCFFVEGGFAQLQQSIHESKSF